MSGTVEWTVGRLSLAEKISQKFMTGAHDDSPGGSGFVILFSRDIRSPGQVLELTTGLHRRDRIPPLIFTDQEGGTIVRFGEMAATVVSAMGLAATGSLDYARTAGALIGGDMQKCGIDGVFAPVLDVNTAENNPVIGIRAFSDQPEMVAEYGEQFWRGLNSAGVLACGKHYPGHGAASADSHLEIPEIDFSPEDFRHWCLGPFVHLARCGIETLMTGHIRFPRLSRDLATFSTELSYELLRKEIGYKGVLFSDCLEMKAVRDHFSAEEIVLKSAAAGVDVLLVSHTSSFRRELEDILLFHVRKGTISEAVIDQSVGRILALKNKARRFSSPDSSDSSGSSPVLRVGIAKEQEIADRSVTVLRNRGGALPLARTRKTLIIEFSRRVHGPTVAETQEVSLLATVAAGHLAGFDIDFDIEKDVLTLAPTGPFPEGLSGLLSGYTAVVLFVYSRVGDLVRKQAEMVNRLVMLRSDLIVVCLEGPYEIRYFPGVDHFVVTYGYRRVQLEALFRVLTGRIGSFGRLPVEVSGYFGRGDGIEL